MKRTDEILADSDRLVGEQGLTGKYFLGFDEFMSLPADGKLDRWGELPEIAIASDWSHVQTIEATALVCAIWDNRKQAVAGGNGHREPFETAGMRAKAAAEPSRIITPTPFVYRAPSLIPRRQWLYGKHYVRQYVSATFAPGGLGKTSLVLVEAVVMASGRALLGVPVPKRLRVWYWNGEDPAEETERRVAAILLHFKISREEIEGWLYVDTGRKTPVCIARRQKNEVFFTPDAEALTQAIISSEIDVFILDPFVKTHSAPENDNGAIDGVARKFADIADKTNCAVELTHHVRKAGPGRSHG